MLRSCTVLKRVELTFTREERDEDMQFRSEIKFYTKQKQKRQAKSDAYRDTQESCAPDNMFTNLQRLIEQSDANPPAYGHNTSRTEEDQQFFMPVRKFYNNTFDDLLNRAIFTLLKK